MLANLIDFILNIDKYLSTIIQSFGGWTYILLFFIVFAETGFVVAPFLPGDSLLFAAGAFAAIGSLNVWVLFIILALAAIFGDFLNYSIGLRIGSGTFKKYPKIFRKEYLDRTHNFYERYGAKTIVMARFVPIVRTFAPFVAGVGSMEYWKFLLYNIIGGILWVSLFIFGGYFFGNVPIIRNNFSIAIILIIVLSIIPFIIELLKHYWKKREL